MEKIAAGRRGSLPRLIMIFCQPTTTRRSPSPRSPPEGRAAIHSTLKEMDLHAIQRSSGIGWTKVDQIL